MPEAKHTLAREQLRKPVKYLILTFGLLLVYQPLPGGEYADAVLRIGISPRSIALGNAAGSLIEGDEACFHNPANISYADRVEIRGMYVSQFGMANFNTLGFTLPLLPDWAASVHWSHFGVDDIPLRPDLHAFDLITQRDSARALLEEPLGHFGSSEDAVFVSLGKMFRWDFDLGWQYFSLPVETPVGMNVKYLYREIAQVTGSGIGLDLSAGLKFPLNELFDAEWIGQFGAAVLWQDVTGTPVSWNTQSQDVMHPAMRWSLSMEQPVGFLFGRINAVWSRSSRAGGSSGWGLEYELGRMLSLQVGSAGQRLNAGASIGFRILGIAVDLQYAFGEHLLGSSHRIGTGILLP